VKFMIGNLKSNKFNLDFLREMLDKESRKRVFAFCAIFFMLFFTFVLNDSLTALGRIHPGIRITDVDVGGLTPGQASSRLTARLRPALKKPVQISYLENSWQVTPDQFNTKVSIPKSVARAYAVGREGGLIFRVQQRLACRLKARKIVLVYSADYKSISNFVNTIAETIDRNPVDAGIKIEDGKASITPSQIGIKLDKPEAFALIKTKLVSFASRNIEAPVTIMPVEITEENTRDALKAVNEMMNSPVTLKYAETNWLVDPEDIGGLIEFRKTSSNKAKKVLQLRAELDPEKVKPYVNELAKNVNVEPQSAEFHVDGEAVDIIPSKNGVKIDADAAFPKIKKVLFSNPPREVLLTTRTVAPERTTEEAKAMGIKERVSVFTTSYSAGNIPRVNNIHLLSKDLDGTIIAPGKIFSFNDTIGPRTAEKGYKEAPTIVQGELVPSVGGGVCQVATTLFNAVFFAGYPVTGRQNHSFYIDHYPAGRDATVSWGGPDFKFKNDTEAYLLIKTWCSSSTVTIGIYSTDYESDVSSEATDFTNFQPFATKTTDDANLPKGQQVTESGGIEGRDITVFRTVKRNGKVVRKDKFFSRYKPKQAVVRLGTKEEVPVDQAQTDGTQATQDTTATVN